jgi:hypothetical protein
MSEFSASGNARAQTLGYLMKLALGTVGSPTLVETGVYSHAFTRLNTNNHPSATVYRDSAVGDERSAYHMVDSLDMDFAIGEYVKFSVSTKGGKISSTTSSPSFITGAGDEPFLVSSATIKVANDISGLAGATGVCLQNFKFSIKKNIESIFCMGATELSSNVNKNFNVSGDFEAIYNDNTYRDLFANNTKQAIQIEIVGKSLIGATQYNKLTLQFAQVGLDTWERSGGNDDLIKETVGFTAEYNLATTQTMNATLQNTKSTTY